MSMRVVFGFFVGVGTMLILFFAWQGFTKATKPEVYSDYYLIQNQISKMNKLVVVEQDFSSLQRTSIKSELLGSKYLPVSEKKILLFTKTNVQVSYDLNQMKIKVDSINKKLIISALPKPMIKINPSVDIQAMEDSFFDRFNEKDLKKIIQKAKSEAYKQVEQETLKQQAHRQLIENLNEIFVLAKALHYEIVDETHKIPKELY